MSDVVEEVIENDDVQVDEIEAEEVEQEEVEAEEAEQADPDAETVDDENPGDGEPDEFDVSFGDDDEEPEPSPSVDVLRQLREENRKLKSRVAEIEKPAEPAKLPERPKLADFDFDEDAYADAVDVWHQAKAKHDAAKAEQEAEQQRQAEAWQAKVDAYESRKSAIRDARGDQYDEAESAVLAALNETQQGIILQGSDDPALAVLALGGSSKELDRMAKITDPVKFAIEFGKLESKMKRSNRKPSTTPIKRVNGSAPRATVDSELDRLRAEAEKTGDISRVVAYKKSKAAEQR